MDLLEASANIRIPDPRGGNADTGPSFDETTKQRIMASSLFALCVGNMMMLNVASFLPTFVESGEIKWADGVMPTSFDVTLIISIFSVA